MNPLNAGIIGAGIRSHFIAREVKKRKDIAVKVVAEPSDQQFERYCSMNEVCPERVNSYQELLARNDLDLVFIMSPDWLHEEHAVAAMERGLVVYLEKPMAITVASARRMLETAVRLHAKLYVGHNMRYYSLLAKMKELIDSGVVGNVQSCWGLHYIPYGGDAYFKDWHSQRSNCNGLLLQKGVHDIDVIHWLCGGYTTKTCAFGKLSVYNRAPKRNSGEVFIGTRTSDANWPPLKNAGMSPKMDIEDLNMMLMTMNNGVLASYQQCHYTPDSSRQYIVFGDAGRIENYGTSGSPCEIRIFNKRSSKSPEAIPDIVYNFEIDTAHHSGSDPLILDEFLAWCRNERRPSITPLDAFRAVAAADAATASIRRGGELMQVESLPETLEKEIIQC